MPLNVKDYVSTKKIRLVIKHSEIGHFFKEELVWMMRLVIDAIKVADTEIKMTIRMKMGEVIPRC